LPLKRCRFAFELCQGAKRQCEAIRLKRCKDQSLDFRIYG
jgi:hypothetical protein